MPDLTEKVLSPEGRELVEQFHDDVVTLARRTMAFREKQLNRKGSTIYSPETASMTDDHWVLAALTTLLSVLDGCAAKHGGRIMQLSPEVLRERMEREGSPEAAFESLAKTAEGQAPDGETPVERALREMTRQLPKKKETIH